MKKDIETQEDIQSLVETFYDQIKKDELLSPYFFKYMKINLEKRIPIMVQFWENAIFYTGAYSGNPMQLHQALNNHFPMTDEHFNQWIVLWNSTVDVMFEGKKAEEIKQKANSIGVVMKIKILGSE
ncbi:MAG: hypothetical protein C5B52_12275 [Bacteroidetes bacterium]|nr:MAG: hypothetical protein C5B52_12275 [Bacteroidota bacterium]